jgi:response regulator NasT
MMTQAKPPAANGTRQVLIVEDDTIVGMGLTSLLERLGHSVIGQAATATEAVNLYRDRAPNLVLMDIRLDDSDGIELTRRLLVERRCPVVIISAYSEQELITRAAAAGAFGYIIKPISYESLRAQIAIAVRRFDEMEQVRRENAELAHSLETRKLVEKAKGILMKAMRLDEPAAHRRLQLEAQKRRITIADAAKRVIDTDKRN